MWHKISYGAKAVDHTRTSSMDPFKKPIGSVYELPPRKLYVKLEDAKVAVAVIASIPFKYRYWGPLAFRTNARCMFDNPAKLVFASYELAKPLKYVNLPLLFPLS